MAGAAPVTYQPQETISLIDEKAKAVGADRAIFYVKIGKKAQGGLVAQQIAAFSDATIQNLADPVRWIVQLAGGGDYVLRVAHVDTPHQEIGGPLPFSIDTKAFPSTAVDPGATFREGWAGPATMVMPNPVKPAPPNAMRDLVLAGTQWSTRPEDAEAIARANQQAAAAAQAATLPPALAQELNRREKELLEREAKMRAEMAEKEARVREDRFRTEMDQKSRELDAKLDRIAAAQAAPRQESGSWVKELVTALLPIVTQMMTSQHETRMFMMKQSEATTAAQLAAQEKSHQHMMDFLKAAATPKQTGMSDEMKLILDILKEQKNSTGADAMSSMTMRMVDAMNMVTKSSIQMMEAATDAFAPPEEHPAVAAIREGVKAIGMVSAGMRDGMRKSIPQPQPTGLPGATPVQVPPGYVAVPVEQIRRAQAVQQAQRAQAQARARAAGQTVAGQPTTQPPPAVATVPDPVPGPVPTQATAAPAAPVQVVRFEKAPGTPDTPVIIDATAHPEQARPLPIEILENGIRQLAPIEEVAKYFVELVKVKDPSLFKALEAAEGDPDQVVVQRLGMEFVAANSEYLNALSEEIDRQGEAAGIVEIEDDEGGDAEA